MAVVPSNNTQDTHTSLARPSNTPHHAAPRPTIPLPVQTPPLCRHCPIPCHSVPRTSTRPRPTASAAPSPLAQPSRTPRRTPTPRRARPPGPRPPHVHPPHRAHPSSSAPPLLATRLLLLFERVRRQRVDQLRIVGGASARRRARNGGRVRLVQPGVGRPEARGQRRLRPPLTQRRGAGGHLGRVTRSAPHPWAGAGRAAEGNTRERATDTRSWSASYGTNDGRGVVTQRPHPKVPHAQPGRNHHKPASVDAPSASATPRNGARERTHAGKHAGPTRTSARRLDSDAAISSGGVRMSRIQTDMARR